MGCRYYQVRQRRVRLKADTVVLLDRIAAAGELTPNLRLQLAELRMRLAPPTGVRAPIILTGYTK